MDNRLLVVGLVGGVAGLVVLTHKSAPPTVATPTTGMATGFR